MSTNAKFRIAIIGAGPAGLSLALALKHKGFTNIIVYEREKNEQSRHQGWSISLFSPGGGLDLLEHLHLKEEFSTISFEPAFRALDGQTGRTLLYKAGQSNARRFKRGDLRQALYHVCLREKIEIVWDAQVSSFTELTDQVEVHFVDSTEHSPVKVDLLIGADGLHSPIRQQLVGDRIRPAGYNAIVGLIKREESNDHLFKDELIQNSGVLVSGRGVACWYAHHVLHDEIYWSLSIECEEEFLRQQTDLDKAKLHQLALTTSQQFFPLIGELVAQTPIDQIQDCLFFKDRDPIPRHASGRFCVSQTGRVTLVGDATHAMIPFRGQGGNTALIDVWNLCSHLAEALIGEDQISNEQLNDVLRRYENERIPPGSDEILQSRQNAQQFHSASSMNILVRNVILRFVNLKLRFDQWWGQ